MYIIWTILLLDLEPIIELIITDALLRYQVKFLFDKSIEVKIPFLLGNHERPTKRPTDRLTEDRVIGKFHFQKCKVDPFMLH